MLKNPLHLRLEKLVPWQHTTFMVALCERMYPNFALFCQQTEFADPRQYRIILDSVWESLSVKSAKINFERQLERLEEIIPNADDYDLYAVFPAIDACYALSTLLHALLDREEMLEEAIKVSQSSVDTVAQLELAQTGVEVTQENQKSIQAIEEEWDIQWEIYRPLRDAEKRDIELIVSLRDALRGECVSNIGIELT